MVYVDKLFQLASTNPQAYFVGTRTGHQWCHMFADEEEELHEMARKLGLKIGWFQHRSRTKHYDLTPSKRALAVKYGAKEIDARTWFKQRQIMEEQVG